MRDPIIATLRKLAPRAVYLFGSHGTPSQHPGSDIDLAFLPSAPVDPLIVFNLSNELASLLDHDVDLIDLSKATTVMAKEVIRTGERLVTGDLAATQEFEMRTLADYARLNEERRPVLSR